MEVGMSIVWDLRHAFRTLAKSPGVASVCVLSLGLGIGVNVVLFMALSRIFLFAPSVVEPGRFVRVEPGNSNQFSHLNYRDLRDSKIFEGTVGFRRVVLNFRSGDDFERANGLAVTADFFQETGVRAEFGRTFTAQESAPE